MKLDEELNKSRISWETPGAPDPDELEEYLD